MHTIGRPVETFIQFAGLMYGGIAERFPKLRVAFLECGVGWVPYWMERMDEEWEKRGKVEAPLCKNKPSEYIKHGNWFFAMEPEEETLPYVIERIGDDKIVFRLRLSALGRHLSPCGFHHPRPQGHLRVSQNQSL